MMDSKLKAQCTTQWSVGAGIDQHHFLSIHTHTHTEKNKIAWTLLDFDNTQKSSDFYLHKFAFWPAVAYTVEMTGCEPMHDSQKRWTERTGRQFWYWGERTVWEERIQSFSVKLNRRKNTKTGQIVSLLYTGFERHSDRSSAWYRVVKFILKG